MKPKTIIIIVIAALMTIFAMQNTHAVVVNILFWHPEFPLILLICIFLGAGFAAGYLVGGISQVKKKDNEY
jgi:uncharacterized integral membrane protein